MVDPDDPDVTDTTIQLSEPVCWNTAPAYWETRVALASPSTRPTPDGRTVTMLTVASILRTRTTAPNPADTASPRLETEWMKVETASGKTTPAPQPLPQHAPAASTATEIISAPPQTLPEDNPASGAAPAETVSPPAVTAGPEESPLPTVAPPPAGAPAGLNDTDFRYAQLLEPPGPGGSHDNPVTADTFAPASQDVPPSGQPWEAQEMSPSSHSVGRFGTSSGAFGESAPAPSIKLELNADIIIYGRAAPGQTVEVCGRLVKVNADGTFSVRMALPLANGDAAGGG